MQISTEAKKAAAHQISPKDNVSGLYGPGAFASWLLIVCSVFVSWTAIKKTKGDILTNDLFAALAIPAVACGHTIYVLVGNPDLLALWQVCEVFSNLGYALVLIAGFYAHWKRMAVVTVVTLCCIVLARFHPYGYYHGQTFADYIVEIMYSTMTVCVIGIGFDNRGKSQWGLFGRLDDWFEAWPVATFVLAIWLCPVACSAL